MFAYVARQPIFDVNLDVYAYELLFRDGDKNCFPDINPDEATSKILTSTHLTVGLEEITGGKVAFINFHRESLMYRFPTSLDASKVIIEILESVEVDEALIKACKHIRGLGYHLALDDFDADEKWRPFLPFVNVVKFDIREMPEARIRALVPDMKAHNIKLVAEKVETYQEFERYRDMGFDYFQGYFLARPEIVRHKGLRVSKLAMLELMAVSGVHNFDFDKINNVIEKDVSLTYLLLRFINNPLHNKRYQIKSLRHALTYLGEVEVKKFISLVALANLNDSNPSELLQQALVRAKFCEFLSVALNEQENPPTGFLTGLLSLLDAMMRQPMEELLAKVPIDDSVKNALFGKPGKLRDCLVLVKQMEIARWGAIKAFAEKHKIRQQLIHGFYNEALKWANTVEKGIKN